MRKFVTVAETTLYIVTAVEDLLWRPQLGKWEDAFVRTQRLFKLHMAREEQSQEAQQVTFSRHTKSSLLWQVGGKCSARGLGVQP